MDPEYYIQEAAHGIRNAIREHFGKECVIPQAQDPVLKIIEDGIAMLLMNLEAQKDYKRDSD